MQNSIGDTMDHKRWRAEFVFYLITLIMIFLIWCIVLRVWKADWLIPFDYGTELGTDVFGSSTWIKSYIQNGFSWEQASFSVPFSTDRKTLFGMDWFILLMEIICSRLFSSYGACLNTLYLLSFLTTGIAAVYSLRCLQFSRRTSLAGAIMYTFLQYHMMRGEMHLYLSFYYSAPLAVLIMLWIADESLLVERFSQHCIGRLKHAHMLFGVFSWIIGLQQPYYAFYAAIGIAFALLCSMCRKQFMKMLEGIAYLMVIAVTTLAENINALLHTSDSAMEYMLQQRTIDAIEAYGLKIINLLLPVQNHRLPILAKLRQHYDSLVGAVNREESWISLGLILAVCFCVALITVLVNDRMEKKIRLCGCFILAFVLISTVGGGSSIIGLVFSLLRCYNRMVVYIAMFCVIVFAVLAEKMGDFLSIKKVPGIVQYSILLLLTGFAVWDQTTPANIYAYESTKEEYLQDEEFVQAIEAIMPEGACIFELPLLPTGTTSIQNLRDYELYKPYLHAKSSKWLHMYSVGSQTDQWVNILHGLPLRTVIDIIVCCDFQGVYIDSRGYTPDELEKVLEVLDSIEGTATVRSEDGKKIFYSLTAYRAKLCEELGTDKIRKYADFWLNCPCITCFPATHLYYTSDMAVCGDTVIMPSDVRQYGPYITVQAGDYLAYVAGEDLNAMEYDVTSADGTAGIPINIIHADNKSAEYTFHLETEMTSIELRSINRGREEAAVRAVFLFSMDQTEEIVIMREFLRIQ